jgi:acetyltransferase
MGIYNIDRIFNPGAIAVIGASEKAGSVGSTLMSNLVQSGFQGELFDCAELMARQPRPT